MLLLGRFTAGAGIVAGKGQRTGDMFTAMNTASRAVIHGRTRLRAPSPCLEHQRIAVAHPYHRRNAPEKAVQQVDAPAQIELELL